MPRYIAIAILIFALTPVRAQMGDASFEKSLSGVLKKVSRERNPSKFRWRWYINPPRSVCINAYREQGYNSVSLEELAATNDGECADFRGQDFGGLNLPGVNFQGANLSYANLRGANIRKARMSGSKLTGANFAGADLRVSEMSKIVMSGTSFAGASMQGANFYRVRMKHCDLSNVNFQGARFSRTDMRDAIVEGAFFKYAEYDDRTDLPFSESRAAELGMVRRGAKR